MNDIQKARDLLAKWREKAAGAVTYHGDNRELIVGTAGNPELWDAVDGMLAAEQRRQSSMHTNMSSDLSHHAERIAGTIIAADQRMNA